MNSKIDFSGMVAVITGASSGLGRGLAQELAAAGCSLAISGRNEQALTETKSLVLNEFPKCVISTHIVDVSDKVAMEKFADSVHYYHGKVNFLFNNAGVVAVDSIENNKRDNFEWLMNTNFWGVVNGTEVFLKMLKQQEKAHIINISSIFGLIGYPMQSAYIASKFAVRGYSESLQIELEGNSQVKVHSVYPGGIKTDIVQRARTGDLQMYGMDRGALERRFEKLARITPRKAAALIVKGVHSHKARVLISYEAHIFDKLQRLFPQAYGSILRFVLRIQEKIESLQSRIS